jgi:metallo-beta-lactamase family protein
MYDEDTGLLTYTITSLQAGETMEVIHHGAYDGVTGSCHRLVLEPNRSVLVDCGLFQGEDNQGRKNSVIDFSLEGIESLYLTHVHIDHVGRLPYLLDAGFKGPIYCSKPTAALLPLMLEDAIRLGITRKQKVIDQLLRTIKQMLKPLPYHEWCEMGNGLKVRLQPAGHVLGSAFLEFDYGNERFVFSGDLGASNQPLLQEPSSPEKADFLVLESTYGDKCHVGREQRIAQLSKILCNTLENSGVTIIPAFSLGRTQELLYELNLILEGFVEVGVCKSLEDVDIIVDSPLGNRLTEIFNSLKPYWSEEARSMLETDKQPLKFPTLMEVDTSREHQDIIEHLRETGRPAIVIAGSGMCSGGRVVNYLKEFLGEESTDIVFVGYQARGTPGFYIQDGSTWVKLDGRSYMIHAKIHTLSGYSAHADQTDLLKFVQGMQERPKKIRLVHGDPPAKLVLTAKLTELGYEVV